MFPISVSGLEKVQAKSCVSPFRTNGEVKPSSGELQICSSPSESMHFTPSGASSECHRGGDNGSTKLDSAFPSASSGSHAFVLKTDEQQGKDYDPELGINLYVGNRATTAYLSIRSLQAQPAGGGTAKAWGEIKATGAAVADS